MVSNLKTVEFDGANKEYFDQWASDYDSGRISKWFQYTQMTTIGHLDLKSNSKVLDVGCGTGYAVMQLAELLLEGKACGIDISENMIQQAKAKVTDNIRARTEFVKASSDDIPYPENEFDNIICTNSFHHYPDPDKALREMKRVLRPSGRMVIFENAPDLSWYTWAWDKVLGFVEKGHIRYYSSHELGNMINDAGFKNVELCLLKNERFKYGKLFASIQVWRGQKPAVDQS